MRKLRKQVLSVLRASGDYKMPESTLIENVKMLSGDSVATTDVEIEIAWLQAKGHIDYTISGLSEEKRWTITNSGRELLRAE